jgi:F0F1-type ATP synthase assembly protein I
MSTRFHFFVEGREEENEEAMKWEKEKRREKKEEKERRSRKAKKKKNKIDSYFINALGHAGVEIGMSVWHFLRSSPQPPLNRCTPNVAPQTS